MKTTLRSCCLVLLGGLLSSTAVAESFSGGPRKYVYQPFEFPGAISTVPFGLNDRGDVVGFYLDASGVRHGFKYFNGTFSSIDFSGLSGVTPRGINNLRDIVGNSFDANNHVHFHRQRTVADARCSRCSGDSVPLHRRPTSRHRGHNRPGRV
jgi:probable HAF family extracellular repeat protein